MDLTEPAYRCSCPSRKFPCKHALALLLRWSAGAVQVAQPPDWVVEWHTGRQSRAVKRAEKATAPRTEAQERAASRRADQRADRVAAGAAELRQWLSDQIRHGIAGLDRSGYRHFDQVAARLVDAQAPGLAAAVRRIASLPSSGSGWEQRLLAEFSLLHLLTGVAAHPDDLPEPLAATVRSRVGRPVTTEQVLATPAVRDTWQVIGVRDEVDGQLSSRRVWLLGSDTGRPALVLTFAARGQALPVDLLVGTSVDAELCFYPGAAPLRALVAARHSPLRHCPQPVGALTVAAGLAQYGGALAADPWLDEWPLLLHGALLPSALMPEEPWQLVDCDGDALPLDPAAGDCWPLVAAAGGACATTAFEWSQAGLRPLTMYVHNEVVQA